MSASSSTVFESVSAFADGLVACPGDLVENVQGKVVANT